MAFWEELRKRSVVRVGAAYAVVAWLLLQIADIFFPALQLPDWSIRLMAGLLILGFPIALILAWAYEITPDGIKTARKARALGHVPNTGGQLLNVVVLGLVLVGISVLLLDRFWLQRTAVDNDANDQATDVQLLLAAEIPLAEGAPLASGYAAIGFDSQLLAVSADGRQLAYVARTGDGSQLYLRALHQFEPPAAIPGSEEAIHAFFSPDGSAIGFITNEHLRVVSTDGGSVTTLATTRAPVRGIWIEEDVILLFDEQGANFNRVSVSQRTVTTLDYASELRAGSVSPDGRFVVAAGTTSSVNGNYSELFLYEVESDTRKALGMRGFDPRMLGDRHLLFSRGGALHAVRFDPQRQEIIGEPQAVINRLAMDSMFQQSQLAISSAGLAVFVPGGDRGVGRVVAVSRSGEITMLAMPARTYSVLDLNDDDSLLAIHVADVEDFVWVFDLQREVGRKLTGSDGFGSPRFSSDDRIALTAVRPDFFIEVKIASLNASSLQLLYQSDQVIGTVADWSPDGQVLAINSFVDETYGLMPIEQPEQISWQPNSGINWGAAYSPDGQWTAYNSDETGRYEIWIRSIADPDVRYQVSVNGGIEVVWCECGQLFYRRGDQFFASQVALPTEPGQAPMIGEETLQFTVRGFLDTPGRSYDVSSDGETLFTVVRDQAAVDDRIHVLTNLRQALP